ncbi:MAG TPA: MYXO-CTERM sorting domain-containing protein, partial [Polyangiaceae bacterium]|nr:MYXO-CTERM sorting domain-containing protein [Polyangiaceae bacterium]
GGVASDAATGKDGSVSEAGTGGSTGQPGGGTAGAAANQAAGWESAGSDSGCSVRPRSSRSDLAWAAMALLALLAAGRRRAS